MEDKMDYLKKIGQSLDNIYRLYKYFIRVSNLVSTFKFTQEIRESNRTRAQLLRHLLSGKLGHSTSRASACCLGFLLAASTELAGL